MKPPKTDFVEILGTLGAHRVEFIVVGGVCAVLHGAPISTFDLDLVHSRESGNIARLLAALEALDAHFRGRPGRKLLPGASHLSSPGHQLLMTRAGPLDLLGAVGKGRGYDDLLPYSSEVSIAEGVKKVRLLNLDILIEIKEEVGQEKDRATLPILRRTLEERSRR